MSKQVALITGVLTGIGRATAVAFAAAGANVVVAGRREEDGKKLEKELRHLGAEAEFVKVDVRHEPACRQACCQADEQVIPVDRSVRKLFTPIRIGPLTLEHRLVMAPLTRSRSEQPQDIPGSLMRQYYTQRASKGGLIISEATTISLSARGWFGAPGIHPDEQLAGWRSPVVVSLPCQELSIARQSAISRLVRSAISMNRVGAQLALAMALISSSQE